MNTRIAINGFGRIGRLSFRRNLSAPRAQQDGSDQKPCEKPDPGPGFHG